MINIGHSAISSVIEAVPFENSRHLGFGMEILTFEQLRQRIPARHRQIQSRPDFHQVMLIESGETEHDIDFARHRCSTGGVLHLRPGQVQQFVCDNNAQGWVLLFRADFIPAEAILETRLGPGGMEALSLPELAQVSVGLTLRALASAQESISVPASELQLRALQHLLLSSLLQITDVHDAVRSQTLPHSPKLLSVYRRFLQALELEFSTTREITDYAKRIGCSTKTLSRACIALGGAAPKRLVERRVALEAKRLLAHSSMKISTICTELGFSELTNFVKFFRRNEGITPAIFRKQIK